MTFFIIFFYSINDRSIKVINIYKSSENRKNHFTYICVPHLFLKNVFIYICYPPFRNILSKKCENPMFFIKKRVPF